MIKNTFLCTRMPCFLKIKTILIISMISLLSCNNGKQSMSKNDTGTSQFEVNIPVAGNSWIISQTLEENDIITETGIRNWSDPGNRIRTYFRTEQGGTIDIGVRVKVNSGQSKLKFIFGDVSRESMFSNTDFEDVHIETFKIENPGYQWLDLEGMEKSSPTFAEITDILIGGEALNGGVHYVKDDFYWGRRGPSVHLNYKHPEDAGDVLWFYNEITIPEGNDVLGSYFMANGFAEGYFGIQVNSPSERRILFSVWSPFKADNPNDVPDEYKITLLKKGEDVTARKFGNEGTGGQSFRKYYWRSGTTYGFLLKGEPSINNSTDYSAYFFAPEIGEWQLIASFRRPKTSTYLKRLHSFLENFLTETGQFSRKGIYSNQWIYDTSGTWHELTKATFTADATARKNARLDFTGGVDGRNFFLKNCGFFSEYTVIGSEFIRESVGKAPDIDFSALPEQPRED